MSKRTDSNSYTMIFAVAMVLVVGTMLAFTASSLRPTITANQRIEKQQNILYAMGVNDNDETSANFVSTDIAQEEFEKYIKKQLVIQGDKVTEDDKAFLIDIKKEQTSAKEGNERRLPLFIGEKDGVTFYIAPIRGKGLWDAIWAYISIDKDMVIQGAYFDHKGETAGLGANIKQRFFMDDFIGEHLLSSNGNFKGVDVAKGNNDPMNVDKTDNEVDAIAGATITGNGVSAMIKDELKLYIPYFKTLKK
ncbi:MULTISPECIES: Na(+)-translocating NADH-quinone reductase subunit C [Polaribacter]|uniref:Na(+)-translocating NADH-quinone reductase subunit C n=1 Tax=Polaribacter sejongensis TaxID=985043 RepID=A0AAJ1QZQ9_9FLAO|nr:MULTISPECIES: Na(+)-translocating NADH-quinone reductase subunit C [Polaribacter]AUC21106.1 Na(+)-translocating NADH-quinone reductase subunit C [Polaribacter sejongensis]MDN3621165.1 Na(+)-translocating NADH-quinone reductase subunit C [Polaribacter undariae]UWD31326.1 Na(+)-translocating NADH-quinone reductase subunit C [Polaribacter undariae]